MRDDRRRNRICLAILTLVLAWSVLAFGTPADIISGDEVYWPVRTVAAWATGLGAVACLFLLPGRTTWRRVPPGLAIAGGFLLVYGWFMVWNAYSDHSTETFFFDIIESRPVPWAPGTVSRSAGIQVMTELSLVLLAVLAAVRSAEGGWRAILGLLALAGATVALIGMFHKAGGAPSVYWMEDTTQGANTFAPFVYNANAAAFMNLCLPFAMGLALSRVGDERGRALGIFWTIISVIIIAGVVVAASKGGIIVVVLMLPIFLIWNHRRLGALVASFFRERGRKLERVVLMVGLATLLLTLVAIGIAYVIARWENFASRFDEDSPRAEDVTGRAGIMRLMARMASWEEGSWHGFGPGTFEHLVPYFTVGMDDELAGRWSRGHSDPLETLVEWGWIGAAAWLVIGGGAVVCAALLLSRKNSLTLEEIPLLRGAVLALLLVGLHSCMDFPLSIYSIHLSAMLICGVCWGLYAQRRGRGERRRRRRRGKRWRDSQ